MLKIVLHLQVLNVNYIEDWIMPYLQSLSIEHGVTLSLNHVQ